MAPGLANIHEAEAQLSRLLERVDRGEEVIIARAGKPVAKLVPYRAAQTPRIGGQWRGRVTMAPDFDALPDDLAEALGVTATRKPDAPS